MSSISVKLKETEEMKPGVARRCEVKIKGLDTFYTPNRGINTAEANKHINLTSKRVVNLPLENPIFELVHHYKRDLSLLHTKNGFYSRSEKTINGFINKFSDEMLMAYSPRWNSDCTPSTKDLEYLVDLQLVSCLDYVTVPERLRGMPQQDFTKELNTFSKKVENENVTTTEKTVIPRLSLRDRDEDNFRTKVDYLLERDSEFPICLLEYGPYQDFVPNYDYIIKKCPENTLLLMCNTQRKKYRFNNAFSILHWLQTKGFDLFTAYQPSTGGGSPDISTIPYLKKDDLRFAKCSDAEKNKIHCKCDYCQGLSVKEIIESDGLLTQGQNKGKRQYSKIQSALRLHEVFLGTQEFNDSESRIKKSDLKGYISEKRLGDKEIGMLRS